MMRRMQEGGDDDEAEPMSEDSPAALMPGSGGGSEGSGPQQGAQQRGPASLAEANPPARMQLAAAAAAPPPPSRQALSVDIPPKADSLPEHRIQVGLGLPGVAHAPALPTCPAPLYSGRGCLPSYATQHQVCLNGPCCMGKGARTGAVCARSVRLRCLALC
jgi:hypothetical protein